MEAIMEESANSRNRIHEVGGLRRPALVLLGRLMVRWQSTLRYANVEPMEDILREPGGAVILLWHNRIFPVLGLFQQYRKAGLEIHALVSASRDGALLACFLEAQGIRTIRGSSSRRAATSAREMVRALGRGACVAITVDGPRGPCYRAHPGAALLVQATGAPVYFLGAECENAWSLDSWDRFLVPRPWSRVFLKKEHLPRSLRRSGRDARKGIHQSIQERLAGMTVDLHLDA